MKASIKAGPRSVETDVMVGSENVFADLNLPNPEERLSKALLARAIRQIVQRRGWTQAKAAKSVAMAASDMSDLMRGKLARFSLDRLEAILLDLHMDVHIVVQPVTGDERRGRVSLELF